VALRQFPIALKPRASVHYESCDVDITRYALDPLGTGHVCVIACRHRQAYVAQRIERLAGVQNGNREGIASRTCPVIQVETGVERRGFRVKEPEGLQRLGTGSKACFIGGNAIQQERRIVQRRCEWIVGADYLKGPPGEGERVHKEGRADQEPPQLAFVGLEGGNKVNG
jgi:hypothetical protein